MQSGKQIGVDGRRSILDKVLYAGPSVKAHGGIASVIRSYMDAFGPVAFNATTSRFGKLPGLLNFIVAMAALPFMRMRGFRIAHAHTAMKGSWWRKNLYLKWAGVIGMKTVLHIHSGAIRQCFPRMGLDNVHRLLRRYDAVVALTPGWAEYLTKEIGLDNVHVIGNPVRRISGRHTYYNGGTQLRLLFLGAIYEAKGIFELLDAIAMHKNDISGRIRLDIGGIGQENDRMLKQIERDGLQDIVHTHGWVDGKEKERLLSECDVLVLPSHSEGMPVCILEAMAAGMAVITCPVGGIPELVEEGTNAIMVAPGDRQGLYDAIMNYADNPDMLRSVSENNYEAASKHSPEATLANLIALYKRIL